MNRRKPKLSGLSSASYDGLIRLSSASYDGLILLLLILCDYYSISVLAQANPISSPLLLQAIVQIYWLEFKIKLWVNGGFGFPRVQTCG